MTAPLPPARQQPAGAATVTVRVDQPLARFSPALALGGALDGHSEGETAQIYTRANERAMAAAGLGAVSYRLRTELGVKAWHYAPGGSWSEAGHRRGYWTGPSAPRAGQRPPTVSWGYSLPRRGSTNDQANNNGFSRLDDGNPRSFWKSNPYLDSHYTGEAESAHAQWVLIDLGRQQAVDALRIAWADPYPYARRLRVQEIVGPAAVISEHAAGSWQDFPQGSFSGHRGVQTLQLAPTPRRVQWVRILLSESSHTGPQRSRDVRDRLGYAIGELYLGTIDRRGRMHDAIRHRASGSQTVIYTSSTDPWHGAVDRNGSYEQPSFQTVLRSGLTHGRPLLVPVALLYGTPESAVAELRYLRALGVPLRGVELGEEPDGQLASPEDYGALYVRFARAIHRAFPKLPLGGPGFQTAIPDWTYWPDAHGQRSWTARFVAYLHAHAALGLLNFFSFEWYPFDDVCADPAGQLAQAATLLKRTLELQRGHGLPSDLPVYVTEYGYSPFAGQDEVDLTGALLDADTVGTLLAQGVRTAYMYGYEPEPIMRESEKCVSWGNLVLLQSDAEHRVRHRVAAFWETWMLTHVWTQPGDGVHTLYAADSSTQDGAGHELVRAYALRRPDGRLAVLLLNMSPSQPYVVRLAAAGASPGASPVLSGGLVEWQLSAMQYRWHAAGPHGRPSLSQAPMRGSVAVDAGVRLPPYSITVVRTP
ncbi:MAG TPA: discoidin domain-containing protein [Solirubrobacteraceae bacterium]|nr:discoidin domain-containing protein [Solirubrobacteraceae bacterium]